MNWDVPFPPRENIKSIQESIYIRNEYFPPFFSGFAEFARGQHASTSFHAILKSQTDSQDLEEGTSQICVTISSLLSSTYRVDGRRDKPRSAPDQASQPGQPSQRRVCFGDGSCSLFSIYSEIAEEEDEKMTD